MADVEQDFVELLRLFNKQAGGRTDTGPRRSRHPAEGQEEETIGTVRIVEGKIANSVARQQRTTL